MASADGSSGIEVEYRIDPNDGGSYSLEAFMAEYGGTVEWEAAERAATVTEEYRIDTDGFAYSKADFVALYGGETEWEAAKPALATTRKKPSLEALLARDVKAREAILANKPKVESRIDPSDGYAYSKEDFVGLYGGTAEWEAAEPVPSANGNYTPELFAELRQRMGIKGVRMGLDEEYRIDPKSGDVCTRSEFVILYGSMIGVERWEAAKFGEEPYSGELQPKVGDQILFKSKGSNYIEGTILKRVEGMRLRVETTEEHWDDYKEIYEVKQTWTQVKDVVKIVAKFEAQCDNFRIDVLAVEFGRCKCGRKKAQHDKKAVRRKSGLYRETYIPPASIEGELRGLQVSGGLKDHRLRDNAIAEEPEEESAAAAAADAGATAKKSDDATEEDEGPEFRIDPEDGFAHLWEDFAMKYGALPDWPSQWDTAKSVRDLVTELEEEYRIDPNDGGAYTRDAFVAEYGGTVEWDQALPPGANTRIMVVANLEDESPSMLRRRQLEAIAERKARQKAEFEGKMSARQKTVDEATANAAPAVVPTGVVKQSGFKSINGSGERGGLKGATSGYEAAGDGPEVEDDEWD